MMKNWSFNYSLWLIVIAGFLLRVYDLGAESLWRDEITSAQLANSSLGEIIADRSQSVNPPLYFVLLKFWVQLFGDSESALRFPSVIFGCLSILVIYKLTSLLFERQTAFISSLLLSLSVFQIQYSQEARGYSLMALLALVSMYFFIKLIRQGSIAYIAAYLVSSCLLIYTHFFGIFLILIHNLYFFVTLFFSENNRQLSFKKWVLVQIGLLLLYVPWIGFLANQVLVIQSGYWIPAPNKKAILQTFLSYASQSSVLLNSFILLSILSVLCFKMSSSNPMNWRSPFKSLEGYEWKVKLSNTQEFSLLILWLTIPIIVPFIISKISTPIYYTRYTILASLALYILVARGIRNLNALFLRLIVLSLIVVLSMSSINQYYAKVRNEQWREVAAYVNKNAQPGDVVIFNPGGLVSPFSYYLKRTDLTLETFDTDQEILVTEQSKLVERDSIDQLDEIVKGQDRVWLILLISGSDPEGQIRGKLDQLFDTSEHYKYVGIEMFVFKKT